MRCCFYELASIKNLHQLVGSRWIHLPSVMELHEVSSTLVIAGFPLFFRGCMEGADKTTKQTSEMKSRINPPKGSTAA
jgi:hypothetical protein